MFDGRVTQISPMGVEKDNVTTFEVRVSIDNPGKELKANMTANAEIVLEEHPDSLHHPRGARSPTTRRSNAVRRSCSIPARRAAGARCRSSSASATARRSQVLDGLKQGDKVVLPELSMAARSVPMREALVQSFQNLRANKLRSFLTMFGILWGVISVVILSATGEGFRRGNEHVLRSSGKNIGSSGAAARACRPAASAPAGASA